eukprot:CAMPEP_0194746762 /NCGR_PEP_ID=MMETSP0323_2-20130528/755_1 /TAXON_ID=2866 ORGANISM="Crypthecodinium cohnii, Strain Seligo" /NCGR_SAMPLE_ID=MMETSP0323_2 /ASSEMBLY_ACC=CAM_ASM_000346 /LENGTH=85 /DNA_ID=CAMNT_0039659491 /DNA_START=229 /DNA_END=483 /DNA_ORIENTATION=-
MPRKKFRRAKATLLVQCWTGNIVSAKPGAQPRWRMTRLQSNNTASSLNCSPTSDSEEKNFAGVTNHNPARLRLLHISFRVSILMT